MSETNTQKYKFVHPGFLPDNSYIKPVQSAGLDFSKGVVETFHMEREGNGIKIVSDGFVDRDAEIQSEKCNAGLENIMRLQTLRYGTLENAIKRNADKQVFGDVSHIPTTIAEQQAFIEKTSKDVDKLCQELGISKEDLLKSNYDSLAKIYADKAAAAEAAAAAASAAASGEGGNK